MLLWGDSAASGMINHCAVHQLSSVVKTDHHLGEGWREEDSGGYMHWTPALLASLGWDGIMGSVCKGLPELVVLEGKGS